MDRSVTVVIPVYNRVGWIESSLRSVCAQQGVDLSVVVVDNGSTDGSVPLLERLCRELGVTLLHEKRRGAAAARNCGLMAVTTPWVAFFDSDDIMLPGHLKRLMDAAEAGEGTEIAGAPVRLLRRGKQVAVKPFNGDMASHLMHCTLATQRYMARTELMRRVGGWDESLPGWDDYELGVRLLAANPKVAAVDGEPLVEVNLHDDSLTGRNFSDHPERWEVALTRIGEALKGTEYIKYVCARRVILNAMYSREGHGHTYESCASKSAQLSSWQRAVLALIAASVRLTGHGGAFLALKLL